ncbi:MAG: hypothetical protein KA954_14220 [Chitinophagales bacterium]|nr:hypothetical protein [Chitinophagales bacterium]MBP8755064.1 hypothetical protein [Chitinophagales bacterium]MBP9188665.1 hypothetical protein [Chitinophagales bacterium]MBP9548538.1 hypothetical protein [Chitinophagales bacterium]MBP9705558.1 hypothetical protein [Chitinophagales bacterium]
MDNATIKSRLIDFGIAVAVFLTVSVIFFMPVFQGKVLIQSDIISFKAMSEEILNYNDTHDDVALWTGSGFSGMPTYQIHLGDTGNLFERVHDFIGLNLPRPANYIFIGFLFFYILLRSFKVNNWIAISGALCYGLGTYMISFIEAGHNSKVNALVLAPIVFAGINYLFRDKLWLGISLALLGMCLEITANHVQISYYLFFIIGFWFLSELYYAIKEKTLPKFLRTLGIFAGITIIALVVNASRLLTTYEYSKETIRGGSELTEHSANYTNEGLDKDYVFAWSYGVGESLTLMYPSFAGQASSKSFLENPESKTMLYMQGLAARNQNKAQQLQQLTSKYWGKLPFTSGPVYVGAIICFLFLIAVFLAEGRLRWWLIAATILSLFLGWGKNFPAFNDAMFNYFPLYNKFRTVMMALIIACLAMPLLAFIMLDKLLRKENAIPDLQKITGLKYAAIAAGVISIFVLVPTLLFNMTSPRELELMAQNSGDTDLSGLIAALKQDRISMIRMDGVRTLFFIGIAAAMIWFYIKNKINKIWVIAVIGILSVVDLWTTGRTYLTNENYGDSNYYEQYFLSQMPKINDADPNFRVFNTTRRLDQDGFTSYSYKSLGGYNAAKLGRYQDLIDGYISKGNLPVINMLNAKYVISNRNNKLVVEQNPGACGNAWFVDSIVFRQGADAEFKELENLQPLKFAVVDEQFKNQIPATTVNYDSTASIQMATYSPNEITYISKNNVDAPAIFSEIWYRGNQDWKAYIDGNYVDHFRANYTLRGLWVPAGSHEITFRFEPASYVKGRKISLAGSSIMILLICGGLFMAYRKNEW